MLNMLNRAPSNNSRYRSGLYIPNNPMKVLKLNDKGGLYYRSGLEHKFMIYFDNNPKIITWGCECIEVEYKKETWDATGTRTGYTKHRYYPDVYYEFLNDDGELRQIVAEIKPHSQTESPILPKNYTNKQLKNFEYDLKEWKRNTAKWEYVMEYCERKGFTFIILTEKLIG